MDNVHIKRRKLGRLTCWLALLKGLPVVWLMVEKLGIEMGMMRAAKRAGMRAVLTEIKLVQA